MIKSILRIVIAALALTIGAAAQSFVSIGAQYKNGEFKEAGSNSNAVDGAYSVGGFVEAARDFQPGAVIIAPRVLGSVGRNFPRNGPNLTEYEIRPEIEVRVPLFRGVQPLIASGLNYYKQHGGDSQLNPILGGGLQFHEIRGTVYRFFPDGDSNNIRGYLYRVDYMKKLSPLGLRLSGEIFSGESDSPYKYHPGYQGYVVTFRAGIVK